MSEFVDDYISESIKNGYSSVKEICARALDEIDEINKKIQETNKLRVRENNLKELLKNFNHDSVKRVKKSISATCQEVSSENVNKSLISNIYNFIESKNVPVSAREILDSAGKMEQQQEIYMVLKFLCENGILSRNDNRHFIFGPNWENKVNLLD
jgi:hypothetical protein